MRRSLPQAPQSKASVSGVKSLSSVHAGQATVVVSASESVTRSGSRASPSASRGEWWALPFSARCREAPEGGDSGSETQHRFLFNMVFMCLHGGVWVWVYACVRVEGADK